eukprot:scaffold67190_cov15-Tisochrysis_lutea.AAC.1
MHVGRRKQRAGWEGGGEVTAGGGQAGTVLSRFGQERRVRSPQTSPTGAACHRSVQLHMRLCMADGVGKKVYASQK